MLLLWPQMCWPAVVLDPELFSVNGSHMKPQGLETLGIHNWLFLHVLLLKADDTYLQLKKDLEYLDLKVSDDAGGLASLGHTPF